MKLTQILTVALGLGLVAGVSPAFSSKLHIKNENAKELTVLIQSEGSSSETVHWVELPVLAKSEKDIVVTEETMGGKKTFSVKGKTNPMTPKGISSNMDINKNYNLTFKDSSLGTECVCELAKD